MNKYLEKIAGFKGQSTSHLSKRVIQLHSAMKNFDRRSPNSGYNKMLKAETRRNKVVKEMLNRPDSPHKNIGVNKYK